MTGKPIVTKTSLENVANEDDILVRKLEEAGLNRNEAVIYLAMLRFGNESGASKIALLTGIHRQYVYVTLEKLVAAGLVLAVPTGARHKYRAMPPSAIERFARKKFDVASETAQTLTRISALGDQQEFEIYLGDRQVREYETDFMSRLKEEETQYVISGASQNFLKYFQKEYDSLAIKGKMKKLNTLYVGGPHEKESLAYAHQMNPGFQYRLLDGMPNGVTSTVIRHESVVIYSLAQPPLVYVIHSKIVSDEYRTYFDMLWKLGK